ncbi:hypothetical protein Q7F20_02080 [Curtobacterium sp. A7_M15]|uniref:hypothetical protein n=1 Tax=Curtobacterium sp. A7_M15 TaxID=3065241 RepID=UPI002737CF0A|nr:hypothetical protein [Curtobacterium sp. A7_M15]MDP4332146.1 hypothetical protein [Curtobacterium sp. A7_M15]
MRNFAASTLAAVVAAMLAACGFVVGVVGSVESAGGLAARTSIAITDLPFGLTTSEHVEALRRTATDNDVELAMLVPDRAARADVWTAYTFSGEPAQPVFRGAIDVRPIGDQDDLDLRTSYAVDGPGTATHRFLEQLGNAGYRFEDVTPTWLDAVAYAAEKPTTSAAGVVTALGVLVALIAESVRRAPRQRLRWISGWQRRRIALVEAAETGVVVAIPAAASVAGFLISLSLRHANSPVWEMTMTILVGVLVTSGGLIVAVHTALSLWWAREGVGHRSVRSLRPLVAGIAAVLLVLAVIDFRSANEHRSAADAIEPRLRAEAEHGDDVVLGTGFTTFEQDVAFGESTLEMLKRGEAGLAKVPVAEHVTVAGRMPPALHQFVSRIADAGPGGQPVLLVPAVLAAETDALRQTAHESLLEGWEVQNSDPPHELDVRAMTVRSTAAVTTSVADWAGGTGAVSSSGRDVPVLVVQDPADIAPNRIGTAVANGEVRFTDRSALEAALTARGLSSSVLQVRRVGAVVDGKLAALRADRRASETTGVATLAVLAFTSAALVIDHRVRTRRSARLFALLGRHPAVPHRRFVLTGVVMTVVVGAATQAVLGEPPGAAAANGAIAGVGVGVLLVCLLVLTARHGRSLR